jgi:hypothetical protein
MTILIQITDPKVLGLLNELEAMHLIKVLEDTTVPEQKLSDKYKGVFTKEDAQSFDNHTRKLRKEY